MWQFLPSQASRFLGIEFNPSSPLEKLISILGGALSIWLVIWSSYEVVGFSETPLMVASMGASTILLFAVPHGALSQPWPLVMGHLVSAIMGVSCAKFIPNVFGAAALAIALSMAAMHYLRCIHPPGGATALVAVMGGPNIQSLGYHYVITPVLLNVMVLLVTAIIINYAFPWRRYPACLKSPLPHAGPPQEEDNDTHQSFTHSDLEYALKQLNSFIDVTEEDLDKIYTLAVQHAQNTSQLTPIEEIIMGHYYSNGQYGETWAIRQVIAISKETDDISYRVVAGKDCRQIATSSSADFVQWARYEVYRDDNSWRRVE